MAHIKRLPMPILDSYEWQFEGACNEADPEVFFSPQSERGARVWGYVVASDSVAGLQALLASMLAFALAALAASGYLAWKIWGGKWAQQLNARRTGGRNDSGGA